ncbi:MAG: hypothetical protein JXR97_14310 [Planctomycetes bacterium]|nr:hypothetical protein [Planctomycetota bacterium]
MIIHCKSCNAKYNVPDDKLGIKFWCKKCKAIVTTEASPAPKQDSSRSSAVESALNRARNSARMQKMKRLRSMARTDQIEGQGTASKPKTTALPPLPSKGTKNITAQIKMPEMPPKLRNISATGILPPPPPLPATQVLPSAGDLGGKEPVKKEEPKVEEKKAETAEEKAAAPTSAIPAAPAAPETPVRPVTAALPPLPKATAPISMPEPVAPEKEEPVLEVEEQTVEDEVVDIAEAGELDVDLQLEESEPEAFEEEPVVADLEMSEAAEQAEPELEIFEDEPTLAATESEPELELFEDEPVLEPVAAEPELELSEEEPALEIAEPEPVASDAEEDVVDVEDALELDIDLQLDAGDGEIEAVDVEEPAPVAYEETAGEELVFAEPEEEAYAPEAPALDEYAPAVEEEPLVLDEEIEAEPVVAEEPAYEAEPEYEEAEYEEAAPQEEYAEPVAEGELVYALGAEELTTDEEYEQSPEYSEAAADEVILPEPEGYAEGDTDQAVIESEPGTDEFAPVEDVPYQETQAYVEDDGYVVAEYAGEDEDVEVDSWMLDESAVGAAEAEQLPDRSIRAYCIECYAHYRLPFSYASRSRLKCCMCHGAVEILGSVDGTSYPHMPAGFVPTAAFAGEDEEVEIYDLDAECVPEEEAYDDSYEDEPEEEQDGEHGETVLLNDGVPEDDLEPFNEADSGMFRKPRYAPPPPDESEYDGDDADDADYVAPPVSENDYDYGDVIEDDVDVDVEVSVEEDFDDIEDVQVDDVDLDIEDEPK